MSWVCVPKLDTRAHLNVHIIVLFSGMPESSSTEASSLDQRSPHVDPSVRITYHPVIKKLSRSGFYTKSGNHVVSQCLMVFNTESITVERLKITDHIPMSQNAQTEVKLVSPALTPPSKSNPGTSAIKAGTKTVSPQVLDAACGVSLNWVYPVPSQAKINLALEWEVTVSPASARIVGV
ncbi:hypothetical protein FB451DRAFT_1183919 [Mycena latifolia]|nr:hypothetical protein FB451DRAFT_1183919 [Mycena latifolia]